MKKKSAVVLIVEDEMILRMRAVDMVEDAGFTPLEAIDADQAMTLLESRSDIELLFTDIQMPGSMDGIKLAFAVHERWPSIKIILVSGQIKPVGDEKPADSRFFGKPLDLKTMIHEMQEMIGKGSLEIVPPQLTDLTPVVTKLISSKIATPKIDNLSESILTAENDSLRFLLEQATVNTEQLLKQAGIDAKEREAADELQKLILEELHHRIKNTLATVGAIASQSLRTAETIEHGIKAIDGRLIALGRAHDLLLKSRWTNASLIDTLRGATEPYDSESGRRISLVGDDIDISSGAVIALSMTVNELCTNATKFGALSVSSGRVLVEWKLEPSTGMLQLVWSETGGPQVEVPTRRSFGTRLMDSLGQQLRGDVSLSYEPSGFIYRLTIPLSSLKSSA